MCPHPSPAPFSGALLCHEEWVPVTLPLGSRHWAVPAKAAGLLSTPVAEHELGDRIWDQRCLIGAWAPKSHV